MSGKAPYFPNNWKRFKEAPAELFETHTFEEIMEWKIAAWELPADVVCVIRATNLKTKKVKEHVYKRQHAAENKVRDYMDKQTHEFCVCTHDAIHYVHPENVDYDDSSDI
ncbi:hypothetical protein STIP37_8 [Synechococcus T7-like phage S-TIP37]|uniref:Uncharacterized protein n=1 Tax=Synechococcus T7-like phage S-TIP37 TaxID=1332145 RepID=A0A345AY89_9CAUD|nr:hypothetical protein HOT80_gp08 [Synechococcus T7-like phage S-TIP37]AXF42069.1 hypothetical protein STIP37_8 [Synechococcus T7-like phage S-TIP37]